METTGDLSAIALMKLRLAHPSAASTRTTSILPLVGAQPEYSVVDMLDIGVVKLPCVKSALLGGVQLQ